ncbi:MAG TPA: FxSxx-COOH system tetratricopeptide repeat protein [Pseudonocardiaceae bacterium]|jgi:cellulose biosynthesis protein BcsQ/tetratricopeptide (TPR) repeat protein|nr:FxSxx-COOH system tetratricopeptide repeat protein [Pseudonocardiaceae bacterium]
MTSPSSGKSRDLPERPGQVITFYSYKGGTGRTMTVANVAWILAGNGLRVLTVDWDLESPGLHRYFHPFLLDKQLRSTRGVIDMVRDFSTAAMDPHGDDDPGWFEQYANVLHYAVSLDWQFQGVGTLDFLPAGLQDAPYSRAVSTYDWAAFYDRQGGGIFLQELLRTMRQNYDYILIDSRTGLSDTAGICTVQLPDVVVNCFTMSTQSIDGAASVAHAIRSQRNQRPARIMPVPTRVEDAEQVKLEAGRDYARLRFESFLTELSTEDVDRYWGDVEIPYKPYYAYEEILATFGERSHQENTLLAAYERLTAVLTNGAVTEMTPIGEQQRRRWLAEFERSTAPVANDMVISFASMDRMWAEWIHAELSEAKVHVVLHEIDFASEPSALPDVEGIVGSAGWVLVLLSQDYVRSPNAVEFWKQATGQSGPIGGRTLVSVRLDTVRLTAPFTERLPVDLAGLNADRCRDALFAALDQPTYPSQRRGDADWWGPRFPATPPAVSNLPQRNGSFTGRGGVLANLRNQLSGNVTVVMPQTLYGLGGVGKTQVALEYAYRFAANYDVIWWISAEQLNQARSGLARLAAQLQLPTGHSVAETVGSVLDALRQGRPYSRWLLVFDNADDPDELLQYLPSGGPGHVIVTSRNQAWARQANAVEVGVFARQESIACLRKRVPTLSGHDAEEIAEKLGDLPLAVEQAGAWLAATAMPAAGYLELLETRLPAVLGENPPPDYRSTAAATWLVSLDRLRTDTPAAAKLLEVCAFLAPETIPMSLISSERFIDALVPYDPTLRDPLLQGRMIREIGRYALARVDSGQTGIQIHRLVQAVIRDTLEPEDRAANRAHVHEILAAANPRDTDQPANWDTYADLWPHVVPSRALQSRSREVRQLIVDLARFLWKRSDYTSSQELAEAALDQWDRVFGQDDPVSLVLRVTLANALRSQANYVEAHRLDVDTRNRLRGAQGIGDDHPYTLMAASGLAADLRALGNYKEARELDEDTFQRLAEVFGEDHPRTLMAGHNLGVSMRLVGDFEGATRLDEDTLERRRKVLGDRHPYTLFSANDLGRDLREAGQFRRSRELLETTLADYRSLLGEQNAETLWTAKNLAVTLRKLGEFTAARALTEETLALHERLHGPNHPDTLACRMNLGCDLSALDDNAAARALVQEVYNRYREVLGEQHPFALACANNLSIFIRKGGDHQEARKLSEGVVDGFRATLGENHPYTLACILNLINDLYESGEYARARQLDEETYGKIRRALGDEHPDTLAAANNLAISRKAAGDRTGAQLLRERTLTRSRQALGENHPNTVAIRTDERLNCDIEPPPT